MAQKNVSFAMTAKDEASGKVNQLSKNINTFSKNIKESLKPLDNLGKSLKSIGQMGVGIGAISLAFNKVKESIKNTINQMKEFESSWAEVEKSVTRLDFAAKINDQLRTSSRELQDFANQLSDKLKTTFAGGDIINAMSTLAFDKTDEQIKAIITTATDLSVAMGTDLNTAVTQLNNTFSGTTGQLGKMFPELKTLSAEALKSGEAVELVSKKVKGMAEEMSKSVSGSLLRSKNLSSDLKEELGYWISDFFNPIRKQINDIKEKWRDALSAKRSLKEARERSSDGSADIADYRVLLADAINRKAKIKEMGGLTQQNDLESVNREIQKYTNQITRLAIAEEQAAKAVVEATQTAGTETSTSSTSGRNHYGEGVSTTYDVDFNGFFNDLQKTIAEKRAEDAKALEENKKAREESQKIEQEKLQAIKELKMSPLINNTGEIGNYINAALEGGELGLAMKFVGDILTRLSEESGIINTFFNSITYFMDQWIGPLVKLIEPVINPILTIIQGMGQILASQLSLWQPYMDYVAGVMRVIGGAIYWVQMFYTNILDTLDILLVSLENWFIKLYNAINGWGKDAELKTSNKTWTEIKDTFKLLFSKDYLDYYDQILQTNYETLQPATSSGSNSARYTAERDIYVTINYNNSFVNGDAREIALQIESELKSAHALGY